MNERKTTGRSAGAEGFTLIEVVVALLVFAILSTGIVAGATTVIRMTDDNRARITAANLASQDLDVVRAIGDPFSIEDTDGYSSIDGRSYRVIPWQMGVVAKLMRALPNPVFDRLLAGRPRKHRQGE